MARISKNKIPANFDSLNITRSYANHNYIELYFKKNNRLGFSEYNAAGHFSIKYNKKYYWHFDDIKRELSLFSGKKLIGHFRINDGDDKLIYSHYRGHDFWAKSLNLIRLH